MTETFDPNVTYKDVPGFRGYRAGTDGSVWSCHRQGPGTYYNETWHKLKQSMGGKKRTGLTPAGSPRIDNQYLIVTMMRSDGKRVSRMVHTVVLETFVCQRRPGLVARHFPDPDRMNNNLSNLVWGSHKQNCEDRKRDGNNQHGERNVNAKITEDDVRIIRAASYHGAVAEMCRRFGLSTTTVIAIRKFRTWKHVR